MRDIVFDVETTGLDPYTGDRITEVGCVEVVDFLPTGRTYQSYVNPQRDVDAKAVEITGLTTEFLRGQPLFADIVSDLCDFIGDARVVAHNASFDRGFLNMELERAGRPIVEDGRWVDTLALARVMFPGSPNSLDALCKRFHISLEARDKHGALLDSELLARVYLELNGGRERSLDLNVAAGDAARQKRQSRFAGRRPTAPLSTAEEHAAHHAFVEGLGGEEPVWARHGLGPVKTPR